ncbi:hypothetical protein [Paenibacillus sp. TC-CSREp1]
MKNAKSEVGAPEDMILVGKNKASKQTVIIVDPTRKDWIHVS